MNTGLSRKRLAYLLIGGLLTAGCGVLVWMGMILSWRSPWHDLEYLLTFVLHPTTLLFFLGICLFVRGIFMRVAGKDRHDDAAVGETGGGPSGSS